MKYQCIFNLFFMQKCSRNIFLFYFKCGFFIILLFPACAPRFEKESIVMCTEFSTKNENNKALITEINKNKKNRIDQLGLKCDTTSIVNVDLENEIQMEASTIWGIYAEIIRYSLRNYSIKDLLNELYEDNMSISEKNRIITEIKNWLDDPEMPEDVRNQIIKGLSLNL